MPEVIPYFKNDIVYPDTTYEPPFVFFGDVGALKFTIYCTQDADFGFEWAVDTQYEVIAIDTFQALAGVENSITVPVTARYGRIFVRNIAAVPSNLKVQIFFLNNFSSGDVESTGSGISLVDDGDIKSLTSVDGSVIITDNITEIDLSVISVNTGMVTVGITLNADFPTIAEAVTAMNCNLRIITDVVETQQTDLSINCNHLRFEMVPGITLSNNIPSANPWFIGDNTLLTINGAGSTIDFISGSTSSKIILQNNQTFRDGLNAELDVSQVRFTGSGVNNIVGGSSRVHNCRFDGATQFNLSLFERSIYITGCLFTVPSLLDREAGPLKSAIITENIFEDGASVLINGTNSLIFSNNILGKSSATNMIISGTLCDNTTISNNIFKFSQLTIDAINLNNSIISNNIVDDITINGIVENCTFESNSCDFFTINGIIDNLTMDANILINDLVFGGLIINSTITDNKCRNCTFHSTMGNNGNPTAFSSNAIRRDLLVVGRVRSTTITSNTILRNCTFNERLGSGSGPVLFGNNVVDGNFLVVGNIIETSISNNNLGSSQLNGNLVRSIFSHNLVFLNGNINFLGNVFGCVINNNRGNNILFDGNVGLSTAPVTFQNNAARTNFTCTGVVIAFLFSTNYISGVCHFSNLVGDLSGRVNISSNSLGSLNMDDNIINVAISNNNMISTVLNSTMTNCTFTGNILGDTTTTGSLEINGSITTTNIVGNQLKDIILRGISNDYTIINSNTFDTVDNGGTALIINGGFTNGTIGNNSMLQGMLILGAFSRSIFSGNRVAFQTTTVTFDNDIFASIITGNEIETFMHINGITNTCSINNNKIRGIVVTNTVQFTTILDNILNRTTNGSSLTISGVITNLWVCNNISQRGYQFGTGATPITIVDSKISNNMCSLSGFNFFSTLNNCHIDGNQLQSSIDITGACTSSTLSLNTLISGQLALNIDNIGFNVRNILNSNFVQGDLTIGSAVGTGSQQNIISNNYCGGILSTPHSNDTNNIITSNRCNVIVGWGGGDVVANNV